MAKKTFTADFKAKVAIEAVKGNKTINCAVWYIECLSTIELSSRIGAA